MGKGDKKSRRGKITIKSFGVRRPRKKTVHALPVMSVKEEVPVKHKKEKPAAKPAAEPVEAIETAPALEMTGEPDKPAKKKPSKPKASAKKEEKPE